MDKGIGVGLAAVGAEVFAFAGAAVLAAALRIPGMAAAFVQQVALPVAKGGADAVLAVGLLGAVERPAAHLGGEVGAGNAEDLFGHNMVNSLLQVWHLALQANQESFNDLAQEDTTLTARVEESRLRATEQFLRQQVEHPVCQLRRGEHLVATQISQAIQYVR